jgi:hypothetical protein
VVEGLPSKLETLSSILSTAKKEKKTNKQTRKRKKKGGGGREARKVKNKKPEGTLLTQVCGDFLKLAEESTCIC